MIKAVFLATAVHAVRDDGGDPYGKTDVGFDHLDPFGSGSAMRQAIESIDNVKDDDWQSTQQKKQ